MLTSRQIMYLVFSVSDINQTQGRPMSLADLVNIEMCVENLQQFNQVWEEICCAWIEDMKRCSNIDTKDC